MPEKITFDPIKDTKQPQPHAQEVRTCARSLYWQGWRITDIAKHLLIPRTTVHSWKEGDKWDRASPIERIENSAEARMICLINKDKKNGGDFKEMDVLMKMQERFARINHYQTTGKEADLNPNINARNAAPRKGTRKRKNWFTDEQIELLEEDFLNTVFDYQRVWHENREHRTRFILKSRQIGATWYFAREALLDAIKTGRNQIFLSASKAQAVVFRTYIVTWAAMVADVSLTGENITLGNGAQLIFLGTNSRTAQSYNGNLYVDECFWIPRFEKLNKVARAMATHKRYRRTYISTPSTDGHEVYPMWTGAAVNKNRKEKLVIDLSEEALATGTLGGDRIWRQKIDIYAAEKGGCNLFDIEELKLENSPEEFANLYECEFIDEKASAFTFAELQGCMVDSDVEWLDYRRYHSRPFANKEVWVGQDSSYSQDMASLAVVARPEQTGGKFRLLEYENVQGIDFETQAGTVDDACKKFNAAYIAIDVTGGWGQAVHDLVKNKHPRILQGVKYDLNNKQMMVLKMKNLIRNKRFEMDTGDTEVLRSFLAIKKTLTASQRNITYSSGRSSELGHSDVAWAIMHTTINEPLDVSEAGQRKGRMVFG